MIKCPNNRSLAGYLPVIWRDVFAGQRPYLGFFGFLVIVPTPPPTLQVSRSESEDT